MTRTSKTLASLGSLSKKWLRPSFTHRRKAAARLVKDSGFTPRMARRHLEALFSELTAPKLRRLLGSELPDLRVLDGFAPDAGNRRWVRARGPATVLHVFPSNIPGAAVTSLVLGLLAGSRNIAKVSRRDTGILGLYLDSLKTHDPRLRRSCTLIRSRAQAAAWAKRADLTVAYGTDESLKAIRAALPAKTPFVGYGNRLSLALILKEALNASLRPLARKIAFDVWMADQRGCLSPVLVFAQRGGRTAPKELARQVAVELERLEKSERVAPRRGMAEGLSAARLRAELRLRALKGERVGYWMSDTPGRWMVGYDERLRPEFVSGGQVLRVKGFVRLSQLEPVFRRLSGSLQAVSLEGGRAQEKKTAEWLSRFGVNRVCRSGKMQKPPVTWHHDGRFNFADWLRWTDLER